MSRSFITELERQIDAAGRALLRAVGSGDADAAGDARDRLADLSDLAARCLPDGTLRSAAHVAGDRPADAA